MISVDVRYGMLSQGAQPRTFLREGILSSPPPEVNSSKLLKMKTPPLYVIISWPPPPPPFPTDTGMVVAEGNASIIA